MLAIITNDFHLTSCTVRVPATGVLSARQVKRCRSMLCGIDGCTCGGDLAERGDQFVEIVSIGVYKFDVPIVAIAKIKTN